MEHSTKRLAVSLVALLAMLAFFATLSAAAQGVADSSASIINPAIDEAAYVRVVADALGHRARHRVSEADFIRMSRQPGTVILDARSREKYDELHVKGALNLSFPDISYETLNKALPDKKTRILIYCNNNFREGVPAFPMKAISSALNLSTFITLYDYGYREVYELAPLLDVASSKLEFEGRARVGR